MSLLRGTVNPLNVLGQRRVNFIPPNFAKMSSKHTDRFDTIDQWIYTKLDSRYCIKRSYVLDQDNKLAEVLEIGIEDPKELSMFALGCPYIH
jgi:hypothetical protein